MAVGRQPQKTRWLDLSAHGLELKIASYENRALLVLVGEDIDPMFARRLGFLRAGDEWMSPDLSVKPDKFSAFLGRTKIVNVMSDRIIEDRPGDAPKFEDIATSAQLAGVDGPAAGSKRWLDLSEHEMEMKVFCVDGGPQVLGLVGGEKNPAMAAKLGFAEDETGRWISTALTDYHPQLSLHRFEGVKEARVPAEGIYQEIGRARAYRGAPGM